MRCQQVGGYANRKLRRQLSARARSAATRLPGVGGRRQWLGPAERLRALREGQGGPRGAEKTRDVSSQILQGTEGLGQGRWQLDPTQLPDFPLTSLDVLHE